MKKQIDESKAFCKSLEPDGTLYEGMRELESVVVEVEKKRWLDGETESPIERAYDAHGDGGFCKNCGECHEFCECRAERW